MVYARWPVLSLSLLFTTFVGFQKKGQALAATNWTQKFEVQAECKPHSQVTIPTALQMHIYFQELSSELTALADVTFPGNIERNVGIRGNFLSQAAGWVSFDIPGPKIEGSFFCQDLNKTSLSEVNIEQAESIRISLSNNPQSRQALPSMKKQTSKLTLSQTKNKAHYEAGAGTAAPYWFSVSFRFSDEKDGKALISYQF